MAGFEKLWVKVARHIHIHIYIYIYSPHVKEFCCMQHLLIIVVFRVKLGLVKAASSLWGCGGPNLGWHHQWSDAGTHSSLCSIWSHPLLLVSAGLILRKLWDVSLSCFSQTLTKSYAISSTYFSFPLQVRSSSALCLYPPFFTCWP